MEVEVLIRTAALVLAAGIILSNVDYSGFFSRISKHGGIPKK